MKLNADRERRKQKRRRKEKRKRRENLETVEQRRKDLDNTSLLTEMVKPAQPMEFHFQHDSSENLQIIERRKAIELHPNNGQHADHGCGAKTFCACWIFSFRHSDIDVGLLPCLSELKKCMHQVLSSKQIDILQQVLGSRPFCKFHSPNGKLDLISEGGSLLIESQFTELILNWVPTPLDTPNTEFSDQQWLYDRGPLRNDTNQKTSAASHDHFCYPYTTLF